MANSEYIIIILGMGAVTYLPRWIPFLLLSGRQLPQWFVDWLDLIPVAILAALLIPELMVLGDPRQLQLFQPKLMVAIPTLLFAIKTRSLGGTVIVGMGFYWLATNWLN
jgi:branched-subunit amino acid transport protein